MSYGQCIECGNAIEAHHGVDGLSIRCGHGERIAELEAYLAASRALVADKDKALHAICDKAVLTGRYGGEGIWWEIEKNGSDDLVNAAVALGLSEEDMLKEGK